MITLDKNYELYFRLSKVHRFYLLTSFSQFHWYSILLHYEVERVYSETLIFNYHCYEFDTKSIEVYFRFCRIFDLVTQEINANKYPEVTVFFQPMYYCTTHDNRSYETEPDFFTIVDVERQQDEVLLAIANTFASHHN